MKWNEPIISRRHPPNHPDSSLRSFAIRCVKCGSLRLILIAKLDYRSGEITIVHIVNSRKNYCCDPPEYPPAIKNRFIG